MASGGGNRSWANSAKLGSSVGAIGNFVPDVTRKAFEKHGFPAGRLAADWTAIVGPSLAHFTRPEKIKWPRPPEAAEEAEAAGATLVLRVDGARALEVQYRAAQIMEKINGFLGYRAITEIRLVQAPIVCRMGRLPQQKLRPRPREVIGQGVTSGSPLTNALDRLALAVSSSARSTSG